MAEIRPFAGLMYNKSAVPEVGDTISLPYDKISPKQFQVYQERSLYNIARVILGEELPGDSDSYNKYTRSADYMQDWVSQSILVKDTHKHFYIYEQEFPVPGSTSVRKRTALMGMIRLEEFEKKIVLPHERTLAGPKIDRLNLMRTTGMNFGQIFGLYEDKTKVVPTILENYKKKKPHYDVFTPEEHVRHKLWMVDNLTDQQHLIEIFKDKKIYIADGHHRYTTAINYRNELREKNPKDTPDAWYNYCLMSFVDVADEGLVILPTHRVISGRPDWNAQALLKALTPYFEMETFSKRERVAFLDALAVPQEGHHFGLSLSKDDQYYMLTLKKNDKVAALLKNQAAPFRGLDVTILHALVLHEILGMTEKDMENQTYLTYRRSAEEALNDADERSAQAAFIMRPTSVQQVLDVANAGLYMPQKSTDFFPKLYTGIVMAKVADVPVV